MSVLRRVRVRPMLGQSGRCVPRLRRLDGKRIRRARSSRSGRPARGRPGSGPAGERPALPDRCRCPRRRDRHGLRDCHQCQKPVSASRRRGGCHRDTGRPRGRAIWSWTISAAIACGGHGRGAHRIVAVRLIGCDRRGAQREWDSRRAGWRSPVGTALDSQPDATPDGHADTAPDARANTPPDTRANTQADALHAGRAPARRRAQDQRGDNLERGRVQRLRHDTAWPWELPDRFAGSGGRPDVPVRCLRNGRAIDRDLVVRARAGDGDAFSQLAAGSLGRLKAIARLIVRDEGRAEDAVQDALVDSWRDLRPAGSRPVRCLAQSPLAAHSRSGKPCCRPRYAPSVRHQVNQVQAWTPS